MKTKITTLVVLLFTAFTAVAQTTFTLNDIEYQVIDGTSFVRVTGTPLPNNQEPITITIPETVSNAGSQFTVIEIRNDAFNGANVGTLSLPDTLLEIDNGAFINNPLTDVTIPDSVTRIGLNAFANSNLTTVTLGANLEIIDNGAFLNNDLTSITIPENVATIGDGTFNGNPTITTIEVLATTPPTTFTNSFGNRTDINITVPNTALTNYQNSTSWDGFFSINNQYDGNLGRQFINIEGINYTITAGGVPNTVTITENTNTGNVVIPPVVTLNAIDFVPTIIGVDAFQNNAISQVTIPNTIEEISNGAFLNNPLTTITLPESVTVIGDGAFDITNLTSIEVLATTPPTTVANSFGNRTDINITVPSAALTNYQNSTSWDGFFSINNLYDGNIGRPFNNIEGINYTITAGGVPNTVIITANTNTGNVVIPSVVTLNSIDFVPTIIANNAFNGDTISQITIPSTITEIGNGAFINNPLTAVTIPNSVTTLGLDAFANCIQLETVNLGDGLLTIDNGAFQNCKINTLTIPDSVTTLGLDAFANNDLTTVNVGAGLTEISNGAFLNNQLTSITIPVGITAIGNGTFAGNPTITTIEVLATTPPSTIANSFGNRTDINITVPDTAIGTYLEDSNWDGFFSINGQYDGNIGRPFNNIDGFNYTITAGGDGVTTANTVTVAGNTNQGIVVIPSEVTLNAVNFVTTKIGNGALAGDSISQITIPNTITEIGDGAFSNNLLPSVTIPDSVTAMGVNAFANNVLTTVDLSTGLTQISNGAFLNNQLTSITIPAGITAIGDGAFNGNIANGNLTIATIEVLAIVPPTTVANSFGDRTDINVTVPDTALQDYLDNANWENFFSINGQFAGDDNTPFDIQDNTVGNGVITYQIISSNPNTVRAIENTSTGAIDLPETVELNNTIFTLTEIGNDAFRESQITSITIPNTVTEIGDRAFFNNLLPSVTIPDSVTAMGLDAFANNNLTTVNLGAGLTQISNGAFLNNELTSIIIPIGITAIGDGAFNGNVVNGIPTITTIEVLATTPPTTVANSFGNRTDINITVPGPELQDYLENANWENFFSINGQYTGVVPFEFDKDGFRFRIFNASQPNNVSLIENTNSGTIIIPATVEENTLTFVLTRIGTNAFFDDDVTAVTIPNTITAINASAFANNALTTVTLPDNLTSLRNNAFENNALTAVSIPANLNVIGANAFENNALTTLIFPANLNVIDANAFANNNLTSLNFEERSGDNDLTIGANAFINNQLTDITFPAFPGGAEVTLNAGTFNNNPLEIVRVEATNPNAVNFTNNVSDSFGDRSNINLLVPEAAFNAYLNDGNWDEFFSTNGRFTGALPRTFTQGEITYEMTSQDVLPNTLTITANGNTGAIVIPDTITENGVDFTPTVIANDAFISDQITAVTLPNSLVTIGGGAFRNNDITTISIPAGVTSIGSGAFNGNTNLQTIEVLATEPPTTNNSSDNSFGVRTFINVTTPNAPTSTYKDNPSWNGFFSINGEYVGITPRDFPLPVNGISYTITEGGLPNKVTIVGNSNINGPVDIPSVVTFNTIDFAPTIIENGVFQFDGITAVTLPNSIELIGDRAFLDNPLVEVAIPGSVTRIGIDAFKDNPQLETVTFETGLEIIDNGAFLNNKLTEITLPETVTTIGDGAFNSGNSALTTITSLATVAPTILPNSFGNRANTDLFIPEGSLADYVLKGWTGFNSTTEITIDITVAPKVFLQGASLNPIAGEEDLMRDSLRENGLLPTTSPYGDGATVNPTVFDITGANAIVDWVLVELRTGTDNENTTVITSKAALLQRDGDIVALDGTSAITFTEEDGDYFIAIKHRNHLGILAAVPAPLNNTVTALDFTQDITTAKGENLTLTALVNGTFAMIAGDADGSSQILNTDITEGLTLAGGGEGYSNADADMNGFVLNSDIQLLILGNSGTVQQFD